MTKAHLTALTSPRLCITVINEAAGLHSCIRKVVLCQQIQRAISNMYLCFDFIRYWIVHRGRLPAFRGKGVGSTCKTLFCERPTLVPWYLFSSMLSSSTLAPDARYLNGSVLPQSSVSLHPSSSKPTHRRADYCRQRAIGDARSCLQTPVDCNVFNGAVRRSAATNDQEIERNRHR